MPVEVIARARPRLHSMLEQDRRAWEVRMVNLREVLEPIDIIKKIARIRVEDAYNRLMLRYGMTLGTGAMLRGIQMLIRQMHRPSAALLARFWKGAPADLVVSLIPNFNRAIFDGLRASDHELNRVLTPMLTILTDLADYPLAFLDRKAGAIFRVCDPARGDASACDGPSAGTNLPHLRDDRAARVLPSGRG